MNSKWYMAIAAVLGLSACQQVINHGPVGGADIMVTTLDGAVVYSMADATASRDSIIFNEGQAEWDEADETRRMRKLGKHVFPDTANFDEDTWYILAATGGQDFDVDQDGITDSDTGTQVQGTLHALVKGGLLDNSVGVVVSPLTDSAYRFVADYLDELTAEELQQALDEVAAELVDDADNNGVINYTDVLNINRYFNIETTLPAQVDGLNALADAIAVGQSEAMLDLMSRELYTTNAPNVVAEKRYESTISSEVVLANRCGPGCHYPGGSGSGSRNRLVATTEPDYVARNTQNFRNMVNGSLGVDGILANVRGQSHGGGTRIRETDPEYDDFEAWLNLL